MGVKGCSCGDDGVGKGSDGRNKGGGGSVCKDSIDKGSNGRDKGGSGSWLGIGKARSKELRCTDKGAHFIAGAKGRPGGDSSGEGKTKLEQFRAGGGGETLQIGDGGNTEFGWLQADSGDKTVQTGNCGETS